MVECGSSLKSGDVATRMFTIPAKTKQIIFEAAQRRSHITWFHGRSSRLTNIFILFPATSMSSYFTHLDGLRDCLC